MLSNETSQKFILIGAVGSGKSTFIRNLSEIPVVCTDVGAKGAEAKRKTSTTTAMDYGQMHVNGEKIHLYGAPGQRRFDFMVPVLSMGAHGMLVLIDNGADNPLADLEYYLQTHKAFLQKKPAVIVITHYDDNNTRTSLLDYHCYVLERGFTIPVITMDARSAEQNIKGVHRLMQAIHEPRTSEGAMTKAYAVVEP